jgi:uncharacterized coiled-coil DUF342 family protein
MSGNIFCNDENVPYYTSHNSYMGNKLDNMIHKHEVVIQLEKKIEELCKQIKVLTDDKKQYSEEIRNIKEELHGFSNGMNNIQANHNKSLQKVIHGFNKSMIKFQEKQMDEINWFKETMSHIQEQLIKDSKMLKWSKEQEDSQHQQEQSTVFYNAINDLNIDDI